MCTSSLPRLDVYSVVCLFYLTSYVCVYHLSHGPFVGVPSSQALPGFLITCTRSCCTWCASCMDSKPKNNNKMFDYMPKPFQFFNPLPTYNYIHFKTTFMCPRSIAGVPSSQALLGFFITAPPSVCVPDVIGALAVWIQNQKSHNKHCRNRVRVDYTHIPRYIRTCDIHRGSAFEPGASGLPYYCKAPVCVPDLIGAASCVAANYTKKNC